LEKDARLVGFLRSRFPTERLELRHTDALDFDIEALFTEPTVKLIGNLPYYVSSQLLLKFLEYPSPISLTVFMLQKEMADRLSANPGNKDYGALSVLLQRHYRVKLLRKVPTAVFVPRPEIDSAIIRITPRDAGELPAFDDETFVILVRQGFSQRRKQLGNLLGNDINDWDAAAAAVGLEPHARAETLSLAQWIALTNYVRPIVPSGSSAEPNESLTVVDDGDQVIGSATRAKVHGDNLCHRAVHILVFDRAGRLYLQKRSRWKDRHPGLWDSSAAGHVLAGEDYDAAAQRELQEELGIHAALEPVVKLPASDKTGQEFVSLYRARYDGPISLNKQEIETGRHFQPDIVTGWTAARPGDFAPGFSECWKTYLDRCR
jgi:16S rRNA (adenine1518-N6/adenine1519-N6)-dimethyltransferase